MGFGSEREPQVLDYITQQHKLFPVLAMAYAFKFAGFALSDMFKVVMQEVESGKYTRLIEVDHEPYSQI